MFIKKMFIVNRLTYIHNCQRFLTTHCVRVAFCFLTLHLYPMILSFVVAGKSIFFSIYPSNGISWCHHLVSVINTSYFSVSVFLGFSFWSVLTDDLVSFIKTYIKEVLNFFGVKSATRIHKNSSMHICMQWLLINPTHFNLMCLCTHVHKERSSNCHIW